MLFYPNIFTLLYRTHVILNYKEAEIAVLEYDQIEIQDWLEKYNDYYYQDMCHMCPRNSPAISLCDKDYSFKEGINEYKSKELYFTEKFIDLYFNAKYK